MSAPVQAADHAPNEHTPPPPGATRRAFFALALGGFGLGTAEFVTMGLLPQISAGLHVSIPHAGRAASLYALGVVLGAPLLTALTPRLPRKSLLVGLMALLVLGNVASTLAPDAGAFLAARFIAGLPHGAYLGIASVVAAGLVSPARRGTAMARVVMGLTVSNVVGVPLAAALGAAADWRAAYAAIAGVGLLTVVALLAWVPTTPRPESPSVTTELHTILRPQVWLTLLAGAVGFGGMFAVYTYIAPTVTELTGLPGATVPLVLALFGVGMTVGTLVVGPVVDRSIDGAATLGLLTLGVALTVFALFAHLAAPALVALFVLGMCASFFTTALQMRLLRETPDAPSLSAAMNHAAFNAANAIGAALGGAAIAAGWGYRSPAALGIALSMFGLTALVLAVARHPRSRL